MRCIHRISTVVVAVLVLLGPGGVSGATGFSATARQLSGAPLNLLAHPVALVRLDARVFIVDANAVELWNEDTQTFSVVAGSRAHPGSRNGIGSAARFDRPKGIATDGTDLYVSDTGNNTIRKIALATGAVSTVAGRVDQAGSNDGVGGAARFDRPWGLAFAAGSLWIADRANFTIRELALSTRAVTTRAGAAGESALVDGVGAAARFTDPRAVAAAGSAIWVTDGVWVRRVDSASTAVTTLKKIHEPYAWVAPTGIAASGGVVYVAIVVHVRDDEPLTEVVSIVEATGAVDEVPGPPYNDATGVTIDQDGARLSVTGFGTYYPSLYSVDLDTGISHDIAPFNHTGFVDGNAQDARFDFARGAALSGSTLFVADSGNRAIRAVATDTGAVTTVANNVGYSLDGMALSGDTLYVVVTGSKGIRQVDTTTGDHGPFTILPSGVNDVTIAGSDLYAVANDCAVYKVPLATGTPTVFAGAAGSCGSADGIGPAARFGADVTCPACPPNGITNDGVDLYVADHLSVRKVAIATAAVSTILPAGPPYDPQYDIAVVDGQVYVARTLSIFRMKTTGGQPVRVTSANFFVDRLGPSPTPARNTFVPELASIVPSPDGHRLYLTVRTGVGVIEDP